MAKMECQIADPLGGSEDYIPLLGCNWSANPIHIQNHFTGALADVISFEEYYSSLMQFPGNGDQGAPAVSPSEGLPKICRQSCSVSLNLLTHSNCSSHSHIPFHHQISLALFFSGLLERCRILKKLAD